MKLTEKDFKKWRTGLFAGNPENCKTLVEMLDRERAISQAFKDAAIADAMEIDAAIQQYVGTSIPGSKVSSKVIQALLLMRAEIDALKATLGDK